MENLFQDLQRFFDGELKKYDIHGSTGEREKFEIASMERAVFTILQEEVRKNQYQNAQEIVEEFRYEMDDFACKAKTATANLIFSAAYDVATYVLDQIIAEKTSANMEP